VCPERSHDEQASTKREMYFWRSVMKKQYENCCYEEMSDEGKDGGQSITKIDNSIHSQYWDGPYCNNYEHTRKGYNEHGLDQSAMERHK
jgi:hypothetical protein